MQPPRLSLPLSLPSCHSICINSSLFWKWPVSPVMWKTQIVVCKWNGCQGDSLGVCGQSIVWQGHAEADSRWWAALRRSCLGMQDEQEARGWEVRERNEKLKCALPWGDPYKWPLIEGMLAGMREKACVLFVSHIPSVTRPLSKGWRNGNNTEGGRRRRSDHPAWSWGMRAGRVFYFVNWSVQMEMSERPEN